LPRQLSVFAKRIIQSMKKIIPYLFILSLSFVSHCSLFAQDTSHLQISLITCGPGGPEDDLYTTFGHTAIRIVDSSSVTDYAYNYGTFDAFEDNFYLNFIKGRLMYYVAAEDFNDFAAYYKETNRSITEQVLNLTASEKITVQRFLNNNIKMENRYYRYDFCFDNCTTRVRDIIKKNHDSAFTIKPAMPAGTTFRQAIYFCLNRNDQQWSKLGIDILLGRPCDAVMTAEQMEFLPENLQESLDSTDHPFVLNETSLYAAVKTNYHQSYFAPLVVFSILLLLIFLLDLSKNKFAQSFLNGFDGFLFFITGLLGILLVFMWFGTDHNMTKDNYNLLWAWPTHAIAAFFISSKKKWIKKYFLVTAVGLVMVLLSWSFLPQHLNTSLIVISLLLLYRSIRKSITQ
jgi:Domain of unknown function (DUF4105)